MGAAGGLLLVVVIRVASSVGNLPVIVTFSLVLFWVDVATADRSRGS
jgi:hypothetical protein